MATIVTRAGKGAPLTHNEVDANFTNLNSDKVETSAISAFGATLIDDADAAAARATLGLGTVATTASTDYATAAQGSLADSATQPGDNVSTLTNDAGYAASLSDLGVTATTDNLNATQFLTGRNKIINGNFDIWQRGTSFSSSQYGADRWGNFNVGSSATQSQQSFALGQTDVPNEPTYYCRTVVTSSAGAGNFAVLVQRIEDVRNFAGQTATLSFWAKADASKNIAVGFTQYFGTGGSPSSEVNDLGVTTCSLTTSWQKFTVTVSLPSISGKTLGTNNDSFLANTFYFDAGSDLNARTNSLGQQSGTFDIAQVQLEAGDVATPFERRPIGQELELCQRYYRTMGDVEVAALTTGAGPVPVRENVLISPTMRASPSASFTYVDNGNMNGTPFIATTVDRARFITSTYTVPLNGAIGTFSNITFDAEF